ncbi:MAG TPA: alpha-ribazole phosphatase [Pyrinomonadaceae bacterium]|nr:alpha-ribazole phosphatase [Pyrinomonadaceae bacterium]
MNLPEGVTRRIVLIRHGEPEASAKGRCYGKLDVGLSEKGKWQIERTARLLKRFEIAAIYSSPRVRATESAKIIAEKYNLTIETREDFAEIDFGDFEGLEYAEVERRFPEIYRKWMDAPTTVEFPNGESFARMQTRVLRAADELKRRHANETFAVVSHGGANRIVLANALGMRNDDIFRLAQDYATANVVDFYGEFPVVKLMNLTAENS